MFYTPLVFYDPLDQSGAAVQQSSSLVVALFEGANQLLCANGIISLVPKLSSVVVWDLARAKAEAGQDARPMR